MTNTIKYIENNLDRISTLATLEKFDLLLSSVNAIAQKDIQNVDLIISLINKMEALRFEMAYNKGLEAVSSRLDKVLAYEVLKLSRIAYKGKELIKAINDVLYYEINEGFKEELVKELATL